jgi:hypothetical protein
VTRRLRTSLISITLGAAIAIPVAAQAQVTPANGYTPPDDTQSVKVGATVFYDYTFTDSPKAKDSAGNVISANAFQVTRAYLNVTGNLSHVVAFRITPDVSRVTDGSLNGSLLFRLKYAYAQFNLDQWTGNWKQTWIRLGQQQTPFIDYEEGIYRYRFQGTVFVERESALTSADSGVSYHSNLPNNYGDFHFGVYNGEGYSKTEANNEKAFQVRGTVRPLATGSMLARGWRVTGFYDEDSYLQNAPKKRAIFNTTYEHTRFNAGFDYINQKDQQTPTGTLVKANGWSVWATPFFKEKGNGPEMLIRYDNYSPDASTDQSHARTIVGFSYWFPHPGGSATAALLLDYEGVTFQNTTPAQPKQNKIAIHGLINF